MSKVKLMLGNCLDLAKTLESESVNCIVTSPPYWNLRDYGIDGQFGQEESPEEYVCNLVELFRELRRALCNNGTLWVNLGDSYSGSGGQGNQAGNLVPSGFQQNSAAGRNGSLSQFNPKRGLAGGAGKKPKTKTGLKNKDLIGIPWRTAFALQKDGWYLRRDIIWEKPASMPESATDRPTTSHEYIFLLSKNANYYYDADLIREPIKESNNGNIRARARTASGALGGLNQNNFEERNYEEIKGANRRSIWRVATSKFKGAHFATFPPELITPCILAGCPVDGWVLDPFMGSGTTGEVAVQNERNFIGFELNPEYLYGIATPRINNALADKGEVARPLPYNLSQANAF